MNYHIKLNFNISKLYIKKPNFDINYNLKKFQLNFNISNFYIKNKIIISIIILQ